METCIVLGELSETKLEFLWHTALSASEGCVRGISDCMMRRGSAPLDAHDHADLRMVKDSLYHPAHEGAVGHIAF